MTRRSSYLLPLLLSILGVTTVTAAPAPVDRYDRANLVAWCIAPFDAKNEHTGGRLRDNLAGLDWLAAFQNFQSARRRAPDPTNVAGTDAKS